ncbi:MAG TPA: hypothetical protein VNO30_03850 [Kofleriaceae bacterium]|nr:hypothetical protein [Kofleriaceae bacterium]
MAAVDDELAKLGAILVEDRVLRRVIKAHRRVRAVGLQVPHEHCYTLPRAELEQYVERDELAVDPAALPERVILVRGDRDELAETVEGQEARSRQWRAIFHARIHQAFDELLAAKTLTQAAIRERVHRIGQTEFDEIRSVLKQEDLLLPPVDEASTYIEFVALYLELRYFAPGAVERTFPAVFDTAQLDAAIALDLDAAALLAASRPESAPEAPIIEQPAPEPVPIEPPLERAEPSARRAAERARQRGNHGRAAILAARGGDLVAARADLHELVLRLSRALGVPASPTGWVDVLLPLIQRAGTRRSLRFNAGARLIHDLSAACLVAEREVRVVDAVEWALSRGKRPIVRSLPATREVKIAKHVRAATAKIAASGLDGEALDRLSAALHAMARLAEDQVRTVLRPKLEAALDAVGLHPHNVPERVSEKTLVDELLDRAVTVGRLTIGDLRDALSRNELKLPDLALADLRAGDPLLRADALLATSLDGVYRRGEIYMRGLQKGSSVLFGTRLGRLVTLYVLLPLLGAFAVLEGLQHMVGPLVKKLSGDAPEIYTRESLLGGAVFLFLLLHVRPFRRAAIAAARGVWRGLRFFALDGLLALWLHPRSQAILQSRFVRWIVKPGLPAALVAWLTWRWGWPWWRWAVAGAVFAVIALALNSRLGRRAEEIIVDSLVRSARHVTGRVVPALVKSVLELFARMVELFDRALYRVDEWLRFRSGQSTLAVVVKGVFGAIWFFVAYVLRLSVNLFIEPTVNPIKHFPVVTVAAKLILPFTEAMLRGIGGPVSAIAGPVIGNSFAAFAVIMLPGLAGFLVWELKENWKLYRATRAKELGPRVIGHHGETMARFLRPGFHSGTIPKLFTKLRRAAWKHDVVAVSKQKEGLHHVEESIGIFVERQLIAMLAEGSAFVQEAGPRMAGVALEHVEIGSNRVQVVLICPDVGPEPATLRFELQSGWLVAGIPAPGWIARLTAPQQRIFEIVLAGFYKLAAVDLVREQIARALESHPGAVAPPYDIADEGLVVWPARGFEVEVVYDLHKRAPRPSVRGAEYHGEVIDLAGRHAMFGHEPLYWSMWAAAWQQIARGEAPRQITVGPSLLPDAATAGRRAALASPP